MGDDGERKHAISAENFVTFAIRDQGASRVYHIDHMYQGECRCCIAVHALRSVPDHVLTRALAPVSALVLFEDSEIYHRTPLTALSVADLRTRRPIIRSSYVISA